MTVMNFKVFLPLFIVLIIDAMGFGLVFPIIGPLLMDPQGGILPASASMAERSFYYGFTNISCFLALLFGAPYFGDLSDKFGRKKVMITCLCIMAGGYALSAIGLIYKNISLLILGRAIDGFVAGNESIAQAAIIDISPPERKTINLSLITFASCLGFIIGPVIGGIFSDASLSSWFGYTTPFWIAGALALLNAICLVFTFSETHIVKQVSVNLFRGLGIFISAFTEKKIRKISLVFLLFQVGWAIFFQVVSLVFAQVYHYTPKEVGFFYTSLGLMFSITMVFLIRVFLKFIDERRLVVVSVFLAGIGLMLNVFYSSAWTPWISIGFIGLGIGMAYACILSLYSGAVSDEHQGWVMGVGNAIAAMSWAIGGVVISVIDVSHATSIYLFASLLMGLSILFAHWWLVQGANRSIRQCPLTKQ